MATQSICGNDRGEGESKHDLALLWDPTFTQIERFMLFWKAPIVIYIFNNIVAWTLTVIFSEYFLRLSPINESPQQFDLPVSWQEIVIMVYRKKYPLKLKRPVMIQPPCSPALVQVLAELTFDTLRRYLCARARGSAVDL